MTQAPVPVAPVPGPVVRTAEVSERPLSELAPATAAWTTNEDLGVALFLPGSRVAYTYRGNQPFPLASVAKVLIAVTTHDQAEREGRPLTESELRLEAAMLAGSDNDAASVLWSLAGGSAGLETTLRSHAIDGVTADPAGHWGQSMATPRGLATLLGGLAEGRYLTPGGSGAVIDAMRTVVPAQRFGTGEALEAVVPEGWSVAVKNGWLEEADGWWVTSAAIALDPAGQPRAVLVVLARRQPTFVSGQRLLEGVAGEAARALSPLFRRPPAG